MLDALGRALRLDAAERVHLLALAGRRAAPETSRTVDAPRPALLRLLQAVEPFPAYIVGPSLDMLAWNATASALFGGLEARPRDALNMARLIFLDRGLGRLLDVEQVGGEVVAALRAAQGRPGTRGDVDALVAELLESSAEFRTHWHRQDVSAKAHGRKSFRHPDVGRLDLDWERLTIPAAEDQALMVYSAEPGGPSATALALLGSLAATEAGIS